MKAPIPKFIGARVRRREDPALITGKGKYVADVIPEGVLHAAFLRSPYAHARIRHVETARAAALQGVVGVFTGSDVNPALAKPLTVVVGAPCGEYESVQELERQLLQEERARFVGDPVAVVIAETAAVANDALALIDVDYEPLDALSSFEDALSSDSHGLHGEARDNRAYVWKAQGGDPDAAFARADVVVELRTRIQRVIPNAMEPRAVVVRGGEKGEPLTIWSTTQVPHAVRDEMAEVLAVDPGELRVIAPEVGGGFGAKCNIYPEEVVCVVLARQLHKSIRWVASRSEDYLATVHGRDQQNSLRLAADSKGSILAADLKVLVNCGAYHSRVSPAVGPLTGVMMTGVYDIPSARAEVTGVFTNKPPMEPYRGAGRPEAAYMIERALDVLARKLDLDPLELRRKNFIAPDRFPYKTPLGLEYDSGDYKRPLEEALSRIDYRSLREEQQRRRREGGPLLGIGFSSYVEICGFGPWELGEVTVRPDGTALVLTGTSPHGQGHDTSWSQIVAETLQLPIEQIEVRHGDTSIVKEGIGTFGSRSAPVGGTAVLKSSESVREGAKEIAAQILEAASEDIRLEEGSFHVVGSPTHRVSWMDVVGAAYGTGKGAELRDRLHSSNRFEVDRETFPFGAHVCIVEIDSDTGMVAIQRYLSIDDCGHVINPLLVEGQVHGGLAQGIGQALFEAAHYDEHANLITGTLMDYALPKAHQLPSFQTGRTETPTDINPLGVKGIGEAATIGSTPAVVNAVVDALAHLGVVHVDTPLTPEKIWDILHSTRAELENRYTS